MTWDQRLRDDSFKQALRDLLQRTASWGDRQPLTEAFPEAELRAKIEELRREGELERRFKEPFEKSWERAWKGLRQLDKTPRELMGREASKALVDGVAEMEPNEQAVRAFFQQKAVSELLGTLLYDGIRDFFNKVNPLRTVLSDALAKVPFSSGLLGTITKNFEQAVDSQLKGFLQGFSKIAMERAAQFVLSDGNKKMFRDMRVSLAEKALDAKISELARGIADSQLKVWRDRTWKNFSDEFSEPAKKKVWDERLTDLYKQHGHETPASLMEKWGIDRAWRDEYHSALVPVLHKLVQDQGVVEWLAKYIRDDAAI